MKYELCYLVGESKEANLDSIRNKIKEIVEQEDAKFLEPEVSQKRKMAYKVGRDIRGTYVAQRFEIKENSDEKEEAEKKDIISAISKKINLDHDILRFIIVKADELPALKFEERKETEGKKRFEPRKFQRPEKTVEKPVREKARKEEVSDESIDKKLEEILNI